VQLERLFYKLVNGIVIVWFIGKNLTTFFVFVYKVIEEEKLKENCKNVGTYFMEELAKFRKEFEYIGDVRGKGLMIGVEMVQDKISQKPMESSKFSQLFEDIKEEGILIGKGGYFGNVILSNQLYVKFCDDQL